MSSRRTSATSVSKAQEKRRRPRNSRGKASSSSTKAAKQKRLDQTCFHCSKDLAREDKALFVEEEVGRVFCSEECITAYFQPDIERLERSYFRHLSPDDLSEADREKYAHLRWITLQEPDEVWREKTVTGDFRYTLISEFEPGQRPIWCVCICLFLRGEPSFLYLAFPTKNAEMMNHYRKGERVQWNRAKTSKSKSVKPEAAEEPITKIYEQASPTAQRVGEDAALGEEVKMDGLADAWTEDETLRARLGRGRKADDIPSEDFGLYQSCMDETLQDPDEVWILHTEGEDPVQLYHFIREYPDEKPSGMWFIIVARETDDTEEIEILDVFPTRDAELVECYRRGSREVGTSEAPTTSRLVH